MWARAGWVRAGSRAGECRVGEGGAQRGVGVVVVGVGGMPRSVGTVQSLRAWSSAASTVHCSRPHNFQYVILRVCVIRVCCVRSYVCASCYVCVREEAHVSV